MVYIECGNDDSPPTSPCHAIGKCRVLQYVHLYGDFLQSKDLCAIRTLCRATHQLVTRSTLFRNARVTTSHQLNEIDQEGAAENRAPLVYSRPGITSFGLVGLLKLQLYLPCYLEDHVSKLRTVLVSNYIPKHVGRVIIYLRGDEGTQETTPPINNNEQSVRQPIICLDFGGVRVSENISIIASPLLRRDQFPEMRILVPDVTIGTNEWTHLPKQLTIHRAKIQLPLEQEQESSRNPSYFAKQPPSIESIQLNRCLLRGVLPVYTAPFNGSQECSLILDNVDAPNLEITGLERWLKSLSILNAVELESFEPPSWLTSYQAGYTIVGNYNNCRSAAGSISTVVQRLSKVLHACSLTELKLYMIDGPQYVLDLSQLNFLEHLEIIECRYKKIVPPKQSGQLRSIVVHGFYMPPWGSHSSLSEISAIWETPQPKLKQLKLQYIRCPEFTLDLSRVRTMEKLEFVDCAFSHVMAPEEGIDTLILHGHLLTNTPFGGRSSWSSIFGDLCSRQGIRSLLLRDIVDHTIQMQHITSNLTIADIKCCQFQPDPQNSV